VELPLLYGTRRLTNAELREKADQVLASVGLAGREDHHPSQLSGGQQQRVAIARGLVNRPALLLADEPTGNLDSRTSVEIMDIFQKLNQEQGLTIAIVTHEPDIAQYAKRAIEFKDGKIRRDMMIQDRSIAEQVLPTLPELLDDPDEDDEEAAKPATPGSADVAH
jgi:putative ABC transport system ATP-binding protein